MADFKGIAEALIVGNAEKVKDLCPTFIYKSEKSIL